MMVLLLLMLQLPIAQDMPEAKGLPELKADEWELVLSHAEKHAKPMVLFVRCQRRSIPGVLTARADSVYGYPGPTVLFAVPRNGKMAWFRAGESWSVEDIESAVRYRQSESVQSAAPDCPT